MMMMMMTHERSFSNKSRRQVAACRQAACVASDHARTADKASIGRYVCSSVRLSVCLLVCTGVPGRQPRCRSVHR